MDEKMGEDAPHARSVDALIIGAGPAGLMAAERLSARGATVLLADAKPSVGRKFLMAGKSGLNLTHHSPSEALVASFGAAGAALAPMVEAFDAAAIRDWAGGLGQDTYVGSSGRVFPRAMKASPLLRAIMGRLAEQGVEIATRHRWIGWDDDHAVFETPAGVVRIAGTVTVLALGGASWARLGSDGAWASTLADVGVACAAFQPSNAGLAVDWSPHMAAHFGAPVKGAALCVGERAVKAEFVVSERGLEGGGIYAIFAEVRDGGALALDLFPDLSVAEVAGRLAKVSRKESRANRLRKALRLGKVRLALVNEFARPFPEDKDLAALLKALPVRHAGPRPMDEAISTAGGVRWDAVDEGLMLNARPGVFVAGEMLDWEAPTGGYLLTACLATGRWAGDAAATRLSLAADSQSDQSTSGPLGTMPSGFLNSEGEK